MKTKEKPKPGPTARAIMMQLKAMGWTRYRLCRETGLSKTAVYTFLNGQCQMTAAHLELILHKVGLKIQVGVKK